LLCLLSAPAAQASWLAPVGISDAGEHIGTPHVVLDSAGNATAVWDRWNGTDTVVESAYRPAGEGWQAAVNLSGAREAGDEAPSGAYSAQSARVAVDGHGDTTVIWERYAGTNKILIQSIYRPAGGSWQAPEEIGEVKTMMAPEPWIAVDAAGNATAVWKGSEVIWSAYRPAEGSWQAPAEVSGGDSYTPQAAVDAQGDATAVWMHQAGPDWVVQGAYKPAGGSWEAPTVLSDPGEAGGNPQIALDAGGDAMVVWRGQIEGHDVARAAYKPVDGGWESPTSVPTEGEAVQWPLVALDAAGNAIVVWSGSTNEVGGYGIAKASFRPAGGSWEAPVELSEDGGNAFPSDLVFDASGNAAVVWQRFDGAYNLLQASYRPAEGGWEAPTDLSEEGKDAMDAVVVLGAPGDATAADGDATAVWISEECLDAQCDEASDTIQAAGYDVYEAPSEGLEVPPTAVAGAPVEISVPSQDMWAPLLDFGDGTAVASPSATHTYDEPGEYTVTFASTSVLGYRTSGQRTIAVGPEGGSGGGDPTSPAQTAAQPAPSAAVNPASLGSAAAACAKAQSDRSRALRQLRLTQETLRRGDSYVARRKLRRRSARQSAALRRAAGRVAAACGI